MAVDISGGGLNFVADLETGPYERATTRLNQMIQDSGKKATQSAEAQAKSLETIAKKATAAIAAYASFSTATTFLSDVVRVRGEFQKLSVAFTTMLGSKEKADKLLAEATKLAAQTPFSLQDVANGAKQLLAYGTSADNVTKDLTTLGNVAAGVGAPLNDLVYLYGTLRTQGKAMLVDIRQFAGRGIPIYEELAKILGTTKEEVNGFISAGKVGFPEVEKAFANMTAQGGMFFNLMQEQSKTLSGLVANLGDAWERMLNDIGKSNEGVFADAIKGAIALTENYKTVLDVLGTLVVTYGAYRAAIVATNVVQAISTSLTQGWTIAEVLRFKAMVLSERAMKLLNITMLSNPAVAITTAIAALAATMYFFSDKVDEAAEAQKRLNAVHDEAEKSLLKEKSTLESLVAIAKDETQSKVNREAAIRKINAISPEYLGNITTENIRTQQGITIINNYVEALQRKAQAQAAQSALDDLEAKRFEAYKRQQTYIDNIPKSAKANERKGIVDEAARILKEELTFIDEGVKSIKSTYGKVLEQQQLGTDAVQTERVRNLKAIDEEIDALQTKQKTLSANRAEYLNSQKAIDKLLAEREKITGEAAAKATNKAVKSASTELDKRADDIKALMNALNDAEADARRSGLLKDQSELDRINERYDDLKNKATDLKQGAAVLSRIENARVIQTGNERQKIEAEKYKEGLDVQRGIFEQYEDYKKQVGIQKANELIGEQRKGFDTYIDFLQDQLATLADDKSKGGLVKFDAVTKSLLDAQRASSEAAVQKQFEDYQRILDATQTFNDQRKRIESEYQKDVAIIQSNPLFDNKAERLEARKDLHDEELKLLATSIREQSALYKKLNTDLGTFSRGEIKKHVGELDTLILKGLTPDGKPLSVIDIENLEAAVKAARELLTQSNKFAFATSEMSGAFGSLSSNFSTLAGAMRGVNGEIADTLERVSGLADVASSAMDAASKFASGNPDDIAGGVASSIGSISAMISLIVKAKASQKQIQQDILDFNAMIAAGEFEINAIYRERARIAADQHADTLKGLKEESEELKKQKAQIDNDYNSIFAKIRKEKYVLSEEEKKTNLFQGVLGYTPLGAVANLFGIGRGSEVDKTMGLLAEKSYDELERLFTEGRLTDQAKELFLQLQKVKNEGVDVDEMLKENRRQVQEMFTGTTASALTDSIVEGFKQGKRSAADFADTFQDNMQSALINIFKFKNLEGPLKQFYEDFAAASQSDDTLTADEINRLQTAYDAIIANASNQFDKLQSISGLNFGNATGAQANSLSGAIKGISAQQADLLAGQFGGLRTTAIEQLKMSERSLNELVAITYNTSFLIAMDKRLQNFEVNGMKIKP